eukprot:TRINITY_DN8640_c0_g1_i1.p2 TRINITY_DN8640_c0_g1~~TRINITY_DN8640_c0_g1_i1.p2  ORF type:complete len:111 (-),score=27.14 TRINITY_DN8640_c0_g1_i1:101-433(-)
MCALVVKGICWLKVLCWPADATCGALTCRWCGGCRASHLSDDAEHLQWTQKAAGNLESTQKAAGHVELTQKAAEHLELTQKAAEHLELTQKAAEHLESIQKAAENLFLLV